jgi:hypothetical protein
VSQGWAELEPGQAGTGPDWNRAELELGWAGTGQAGTGPVLRRMVDLVRQSIDDMISITRWASQAQHSGSAQFRFGSIAWQAVPFASTHLALAFTETLRAVCSLPCSAPRGFFHFSTR